MTVVRRFARASAGIASIGLGYSLEAFPHDARWGTGNAIVAGLGGSEAAVGSTSTATGTMVLTSLRNATTETVRLNGATHGTRTAASVAGSLDVFGRYSTGYNNGVIAFVAVFPSVLSGADLTFAESLG